MLDQSGEKTSCFCVGKFHKSERSYFVCIWSGGYQTHNTKHRLSSQTSVSDKGFVNNYECMKPFCTPPPLCGRAIILTIIFALEYSKRFSCPLCEHSQIFDSPPPHVLKNISLSPYLEPLNLLIVDDSLSNIFYCRRVQLPTLTTIDLKGTWRHDVYPAQPFNRLRQISLYNH